MKAKKKTVQNPKKPSTRKPIPHKPLAITDKTLVTTKEKTHNTIEDHFQIAEVRLGLRTPKVRTPRTHYLPNPRMQQSDMSPFSSPALSSPSPNLPKAFSPRLKDQKERKRTRSKPLLHEKAQPRREVRSGRTRSKKEESTQAEYQNLLLRKLQEGKGHITQLSQESERSIRKVGNFHLNIANIPSEQTSLARGQLIKDLRKKIRDKYEKELGYLQPKERRFYCSIVLVQRLWRQRKIKNLISQFISPRSQEQPSFREGCTSKLDLLATQQHTSELIKKYNGHTVADDKSPVTPRSQCQPVGVDLKDLEVAEPMSPARKERMMKFVECLRDVAFTQKRREVKSLKKANVFSLQESHSQNCLMQGLYQRVFHDSPRKKSNLDLLTRIGEKNLERSIELINSINPPPSENIVIPERFQTQMQSVSSGNLPGKVQTAEVCISTEPEQIAGVHSLKGLNMVAQGVIFLLLSQFSQEFHNFTTQKVLKKKTKSRLPGLEVNTTSIRNFLVGMSSYMMDNYEEQVVRRFYLSEPKSYLKLYHEYTESEEEDWQEEEEEDQINIPVVPGTLFYQYQLKYEAEEFRIAPQHQKYSNFLEGLIKIHNLLLANCFSQTLEKVRLERSVLPWDSRFDLSRHRHKKLGRSSLQIEVKGVVEAVCGFAFKRVGELHKNMDDKEQDDRLQKSIREEYQTEGGQWSAQYEGLELKLQLAKEVESAILKELEADLLIFL